MHGIPRPTAYIANNTPHSKVTKRYILSLLFLFFVSFFCQAHARHMVGGRAPNVENERLYRFEFPESPGALTRFLTALSGGWNVSLFHYRNHGSDFGRVLAALQVGVLWQTKYKTILASVSLTHWQPGGFTHVCWNVTWARHPWSPR